MNKNTHHSSLERKLISHYCQPSPSPGFLSNLEQNLLFKLKNDDIQQIEGSSQAHPIHSAKRRLVQTGAAFFLVITVFVMILSPERVLASLQWLIGYISNVGFVEDAVSVRLLISPVSITQKDVTVTVDEAVIDSQSTQIYMHIAGPWNARRIAESGSTELMTQVSLDLEDGTNLKLLSLSTEYSDVRKLSIQMIYEPLPPGQVKAFLSFSQIPGIPSETLLEGWSIPLDFETGNLTHRISPASSYRFTGNETHGIWLEVSNIAKLETKTALSVRLNHLQELGSPGQDWGSSLQLVDSKGNAIPFITAPENDPNDTQQIIFETKPLNPGEWYKLELVGPIEFIQQVESASDSQFTFDPGIHLSKDQFWSLEKNLHVAGKDIRLTGVHLVEIPEENPPGYRFVFVFEKPAGISRLMIHPIDDQLETLRYGRTGLHPWVDFSEIPGAPITFQVGPIFIDVEGVWEVNWVLP